MASDDGQPVVMGVAVGNDVIVPVGSPVGGLYPGSGLPPPSAAAISDFCRNAGLVAENVSTMASITLRTFTDGDAPVLSYLLLSGTGVPTLQILSLPYGKRFSTVSEIAPALPPSLRVLDLTGPPVGRGSLCDLTSLAAVMTAGQLPNLEALLASQNVVDEASAEALAAGIAHAPRLKHLELLQNSFGSKAVRGMLEAIGARTDVRLVEDAYLDGSRVLHGNAFTDADAEILAKALTLCPEPPAELTRALDLSKNELREGGSLFDVLPRALPGVVILKLSHNCLTADTLSVGALQAALPRLASLMTLDLSHNDLGDAALEALSQLGAKDGLGAAPALRFLHLDAVGATDKGVSALSNAVLAAGGLVALRALFLRDNAVGDEGLLALAGGVGACKLASLELRGNPFKTSAGVMRSVPPGLKALKAAAKATGATLHL